MRNIEADTLDQLIADCTDLPPELRGTATTTLPEPRAAAPWQVDDTNYAQVADLDAYI